MPRQKLLKSSSFNAAHDHHYEWKLVPVGHGGGGMWGKCHSVMLGAQYRCMSHDRLSKHCWRKREYGWTCKQWKNKGHNSRLSKAIQAITLKLKVTCSDFRLAFGFVFFRKLFWFCKICRSKFNPVLSVYLVSSPLLYSNRIFSYLLFTFYFYSMHFFQHIAVLSAS